jgi:uncharacterized membrane protein
MGQWSIGRSGQSNYLCGAPAKLAVSEGWSQLGEVRRQTIALLSAVGLVDSAVIALYQLGIIRRLPDLPGRLFDSNKANRSPNAYLLGVPDGIVGALLYAATLALSGVGGTRGARRHPILSVLLGGATIAGSLGALKYLSNVARRKEAACPYCLVGAAVSFASTACALPEVRAAIRGLRSG